MKTAKFWEQPLDTLNENEWEQLCDGCGRCCLHKITFESEPVHLPPQGSKESATTFLETGQEETLYTRVVCRYYQEDSDLQSGQCGCYERRQELVPDCLVIPEHDISTLHWMPDTCAYKLRHEGKPLYDWHPLIAGNTDMMAEQGISIAGRVISEEYVHEDGMEEHVIRWVTN